MSQTRKARMRTLLRKRLTALSLRRRRDASAAVDRQLETLWQAYQNPTVASFWPVGVEIDVRPFLFRRLDAGKCVIFPRVVPARRLAWHRVTRVEQMRSSPFGLLEPDPGSCPCVELPPGAMVIVPGLGFGPEGRRLGQGGGYYDRVLQGARGRALRPVAVGYQEQFTEDIPVSTLDIRVSQVVLG